MSEVSACHNFQFGTNTLAILLNRQQVVILGGFDHCFRSENIHIWDRVVCTNLARLAPPESGDERVVYDSRSWMDSGTDH